MKEKIRKIKGRQDFLRFLKSSPKTKQKYDVLVFVSHVRPRRKKYNPLKFKYLPEKYCPKCGKLIDNEENLEAVENLGMCLSCDHIEAEIVSNYKLNE